MLDGFGRRIKSDGTWTCGYWKEGNLHGYAIKVKTEPEMNVDMGLYQEHEL